MKSGDDRSRPFPVHFVRGSGQDFGQTIPKILCPKCKDRWYMDIIGENHHKCPKCGYETNSDTWR